MGKDALSTTKEKPNPNSSNGSGSPIIFILAIFAVIVIGLYFFKDKLFKGKSKNLDELVKESKTEVKPKDDKSKQETLPKNEAEKINDKFAKL